MKFLLYLFSKKIRLEKQERERKQKEAERWFNENLPCDVFDAAFDEKWLETAIKYNKDLKEGSCLKRHVSYIISCQRNVNPPVWEMYKSMRAGDERWQPFTTDDEVNGVHDVETGINYYLKEYTGINGFKVEIRKGESKVDGQYVFNSYEMDVMYRGFDKVMENFRDGYQTTRVRSELNRLNGVE